MPHRLHFPDVDGRRKQAITGANPFSSTRLQRRAINDLGDALLRTCTATLHTTLVRYSHCRSCGHLGEHEELRVEPL